MLKDIPSAPVVPSVLIEESEGNFVPLECLSSGSASLVVELFCNDERFIVPYLKFNFIVRINEHT